MSPLISGVIGSRSTVCGGALVVVLVPSSSALPVCPNAHAGVRPATSNMAIGRETMGPPYGFYLNTPRMRRRRLFLGGFSGDLTDFVSDGAAAGASGGIW